MRYITRKPIPTAFPLLFLVALLGIEYFIQENDKMQKTDIMCCLGGITVIPKKTDIKNNNRYIGNTAGRSSMDG